MKKKLGVIGAGSAGLLSLVHFCTWLDTDWEVYSIYDPKKPILGIGESTNGGFVGLLERGTHFSIGHPQDMDALDATLKFGSKFVNWREESWINPLLDGNSAIHFNNYRLKNFVFERLAKLWPNQFNVLEGEVTNIDNNPYRVVVTVDGKEHKFDYIIDCTGYPSSFDGYVISDCSPVNRCQIHSIKEYDFEPFTDHIAMKHGWMFGVPLRDRKTFGYLYNDKITPKEEALEDMKEQLGVDELDNKEYVFQCYYTKKLIEGRVCKNGNKALFFEPLVANSIFVYIYAARCFWDYMMNSMTQDESNARFTKAVQEMEDVISYYYQGGSIYESAFWDYAAPYTRNRLKKRKEFQDIMNTYRDCKKRGVLNTAPTYALAPITWEIVDKHTGYGYISDKEDEARNLISTISYYNEVQDLLMVK